MADAPGPPLESVLTLGGLRVDVAGHQAVFRGRTLQVSSSQFELLAILVADHRRVVSRSELSQRLGLERGRSVDVMLSMLRREIGCDFVRNVRKRGWILIPEALAEEPTLERAERADVRSDLSVDIRVATHVDAQVPTRAPRPAPAG